jgi:hypothetical protein
MFKTKDDTHVYIVGALQVGTFKHCVHLTLDVTGQFRSRPWEPSCTKHNFVRSDRNQFHYCCPDTCCSFEDRRAAGRVQKRAKPWKFLGSAWRWVCRGVWRWLDWFKSLSPTVQALIVLVPLFYYSPRLAKSILEVINGLRGK